MSRPIDFGQNTGRYQPSAAADGSGCSWVSFLGTGMASGRLGFSVVVVLPSSF